MEKCLQNFGSEAIGEDATFKTGINGGIIMT
jgi:hypothetical protein